MLGCVSFWRFRCGCNLSLSSQSCPCAPGGWAAAPKSLSEVLQACGACSWVLPRAGSSSWREAVIRQSLASLSVVVWLCSVLGVEEEWWPPWNYALTTLSPSLSSRGEVCSPAQPLIKSLPDFFDLHLIICGRTCCRLFCRCRN